MWILMRRGENRTAMDDGPDRMKFLLAGGHAAHLAFGYAVLVLAVYAGGSQELLDQIVSTLPQCSCGGQFSAGTNPKCVHCNFEFAHQDDIVKRLEDPHMIVVDGACVFGDTKKPYQVRITNK